MRKLLIVLMLSLIPLTAFAGSNKEALADEYIVVSQTDKLIGQMKAEAENMVDSMVNQMVPPEGVPDAAKKDIADFQKQLISKSFEIMNFNNLSKLIRDVFVEVYTEEELKGLIQFYKSPVGQSMISKQPLVFRKIMEISQSNTMAVIPAMKAMTDEFVKTMKKKYPDFNKGTGLK